ncbi:MAG: M20/M25/M40 family metallo-hydrolase [Desulfosudaceae bacterium]
MMNEQLNKVPLFVETIKSLKDTILTNIILLGQVPAPTFEEQQRAALLLERFSGAGLERCTTDSIGNPVGVIPGTDPDKPPIFLVAHLDTVIDKEIEHNYTVTHNLVYGPGITDNSTGVGVLASLPDIFTALGLTFESDIVLAGVVRSIGGGNLEGINSLVRHWKTPIRGALSLEGCELGRLSYFSEGLRRCEISCNIPKGLNNKRWFRPNAILVLNEIINQIMEMRIPQKPRTRVVIGRIFGGYKHGVNAYDATLGFEIQSDSVELVKSVGAEIKDIVDGVSHEYQVNLKMRTLSEQYPSRLKFSHPLVKAAVGIMKKLKLEPVSVPSESELSVFLSHGIPAVTLGITNGVMSQTPQHDKIKIDPIFKGIAQIVGVVQAIDRGVCDD